MLQSCKINTFGGLKTNYSKENLSNRKSGFCFSSGNLKYGNGRASFLGYDRVKLSPDQILADVARRLLDAVKNPASQRKACSKGYLQTPADLTPIGEYKLAIDTGPRHFRIFEGNDYFELQKLVTADDNAKPIKVNVLRLFLDKVKFHSVERHPSNLPWEKPIEHLETRNKQIVEQFRTFFNELKKLKASS